MRKIMTIMFFVSGLMFAPVFTSAQTPATDLAGLYAKIIELSQKLSALKNRPLPAAPETLWARMRKAPANLKAGEQGEWEMRALRLATTTPYTVQVSWGDTPSVRIIKLPPPKKTNELLFLHNTYTKPGNYQIKFTVQQGNQTSTAQAAVTVTK